jgi:hypothetical protein
MDTQAVPARIVFFNKILLDVSPLSYGGLCSYLPLSSLPNNLVEIVVCVVFPLVAVVVVLFVTQEKAPGETHIVLKTTKMIAMEC